MRDTTYVKGESQSHMRRISLKDSLFLVIFPSLLDYLDLLTCVYMWVCLDMGVQNSKARKSKWIRQV